MKAKEWISERLPLNLEPLKAFGSMPVSGHLRHWWWALGGTPAYFFIVQVFTGILLLFYYVPDVDHAYDSVKNISENISYGWYIRSIHKWSANFMIISVILHMIRVFITGSYRKPREINWMIGCFLFVFTLLLGFTGYSLVYEQLSYWGITVVGNLLEAIPFVGTIVADFFRAGPTVTQATLSRMFAFHVVLFPVIVIALMGLHVALMHAHGITSFQFDEKHKEKTFPFFPDHVITEMVVILILTFLMTILAVVFPAGLEDKANPLVTPAHIKPEWYLFWAFRILKLTSLTTSVIGTGGAFFVMLMWPFIDKHLLRRKNPKSEMSVLIGIIAVLSLIGLTVWEAMVLFYAH